MGERMRNKVYIREISPVKAESFKKTQTSITEITGRYKR